MDMNYPYAKDVGVSDPINCFVISNKVLCQDRRLIRSFRPLSGFLTRKLFFDCVVRLGYRLLFNHITNIYYDTEEVS